VTRVLERVELDEYTVDLMVFLRMIGLDVFLTREEASAFGLDGTPKRLILSAAIDVYSGAIVGLQIARSSSIEVTLRTIEMIYLDKQPLADAIGAEMPWPMYGQPQTLALDRANVNMSDTVYLRLSHAGITNLAVPAGKPFLKPWIERFFATVGALLLQRFTGRTFADVVRKGENDPAARATVSLDEFLEWLTRWIVDIYHTRKPATLGKKSPLQTWNEAVTLSPPLVRADQNMLRNAFGVTTTRNATRHGITVEDIRYQHEEIAKWFLNETERDLTVVWWDKKIGSIDVHLPDGRSVTAKCVDPKWSDKSYADVVQQRILDKEEKLFGQAARDRATVAIDAFTRNKAALRGLLPIIPTGDELAKRTRDFSRYMGTAERRPETYGDVFDNEVQPYSPDEPMPGSRPVQFPSQPTDAHDTGDIME
jgi:transposase InsO family protein